MIKHIWLGTTTWQLIVASIEQLKMEIGISGQTLKNKLWNVWGTSDWVLGQVSMEICIGI